MTTVDTVGTQAAPATGTLAPRFTLQADEFTLKEWNELQDIEAQAIARNPELQMIERALCGMKEITNPTCGFLYWLPRYWQLVDKNVHVTRCVPNRLQREYIASRSNENVIIKMRKGGCSTIIDALYYWLCLHQPNYRAFIMAHVAESTDDLFERVKFGHDHLPQWMRPATKRSSKKELFFASNGSKLRVLTARGKGLGRAGDADAVHLSEVAHYPKVYTVLAGLVESGRYNRLIDMETTPNGWANEIRPIYKDARDGKSHRTAFFFPWWYSDDNREHAPEPLTLTPEERVLADTHGLDDGQIQWLRGKESTLGDLRKQEHPDDDVTCFLTSGSPKFDRQLLKELAMVIREEVVPVDLRGVGPFGGNDNGRFTVWEPPQKGASYVIGADVAEGVVNGNFSAAGVLKRGTPDSPPEQVAAWHGRIAPEDFGEVLAKIGAWYSSGPRGLKALLAVERNNHGHSTLNTLRRQVGYRPIYKHKRYNQKTRMTKRFVGWPTDPVERPMMLDAVRHALRHQTVIFADLRFIEECMNFRSGDEFKTDREDVTEMSVGTERRFNDTVFAWAIAFQVERRGAKPLNFT